MLEILNWILLLLFP